ncbi:MAG: PorP/SprF family type IX secretion system membrane protein [Bacteroidia bacterium]|nr:PorP/SprF family type IX secretion system membrane protein [Bacteroidia bacterium]
MKKPIYLFLWFWSLKLSSQDIHFSQFLNQPSLLNPALTGAIDPSRASIVYRDQWKSVSSPYVSYGISAETRFRAEESVHVSTPGPKSSKKRSIGRSAVGVSIYKDKMGDGTISNTSTNLSLASSVSVNKMSHLGLGLQASFTQTQLNNSGLIFPNQYNGRGYDESLNSGESFQNQNFFHVDFAGGLVWVYNQSDKGLIGNRKLRGSFGLAFYHLNKSRSFLNNNPISGQTKYVIHGDLLTSLQNRDYAIRPFFLMQMKKPNTEVLAGFVIKRYMKLDSKYTGLVRRSSLNIGLSCRIGDAIIVNGGVDIKGKYTISFSYDINISKLKNGTNARGGFELSMSYIPAKTFFYRDKKITTSE